MFEVVPQILEQDKLIYQKHGAFALKDTIIYVIRLDKVNDQEYFFHFSYLHRVKAEEIAKKLWYQGEEFRQSCNRTTNPQWTLLSDLE